MLGREDEGDRNVFFERGDVEERIVLTDSFANEETKEAPCDCEHMVHRGSLHGEIGSHVEEEGRAKGVPIGLCVMHIAVKETEEAIAGLWGISQSFPIPEIVMEMGGKEALKGFH